MTTAAHILLVEDDRLLNRILLSELKRMGYAAEGVYNWREAGAPLAQHEPTLILSDVQLPDANTMKVLPDLAEEYPVIVLTAYGAVAAVKAAAVQYLTKPINPDELELEVKRALQNAT